MTENKIDKIIENSKRIGALDEKNRIITAIQNEKTLEKGFISLSRIIEILKG